MKRHLIGTALMFMFALSACESQSALVSHNEDNLAAAGFVVRPANTPERVAMLNRLPAHHSYSASTAIPSISVCRSAGLRVSLLVLSKPTIIQGQ